MSLISEVIEPMRWVLSAMSSMVFTTVCITVPPCVAALLAAIDSLSTSAAVSELLCTDAAIWFIVATVCCTLATVWRVRSLRSSLPCASLSLPSRTLTTWLETSLISQRHISPSCPTARSVSPSSSLRLRCCTLLRSPVATFSACRATFSIGRTICCSNSSVPISITTAAAASGNQPAEVAASVAASPAKSTAITLRTRQRSGMAGSLPSQPFPTTSPL